jgi:flagella basal body P-ring formation protein FlgA
MATHRAPGIGNRESAAGGRAAAGRVWALAAVLLVAPGAGARAQTARERAPAATPVPVAARALGRGQVLTADDIAYAPAPAHARLPIPDSRLPAPGWTTRRVIAAGEVLRAPAVAPPAAVRAGEPVALVYQAEGITLRLAGTAAADAPVGGRVPVRVDTRRRFEGVVAGPGVVRLP